MKIRFYLMGLVLALALPLAVLLALRIDDGQRKAISDAEQLLRNQTATIASNLNYKLSKVRYHLEFLAGLPTAALLDASHCTPSLVTLFKANPEYANVVQRQPTAPRSVQPCPFPRGKRSMSVPRPGTSNYSVTRASRSANLSLARSPSRMC